MNIFRMGILREHFCSKRKLDDFQTYFGPLGAISGPPPSLITKFVRIFPCNPSLDILLEKTTSDLLKVIKKSNCGSSLR